MKPPETDSAPQGAPVDGVSPPGTSNTQSNHVKNKIKTNKQSTTIPTTAGSTPIDRGQEILNHLLTLEGPSVDRSTSPDELDFLGASQLPYRASKTTSKQTIPNTTNQSASSAPTKARVPTKLSDFTELDEELNYKNGENTLIHPELQDDTLIELLTGLKYITTTLTRDGFEETKMEMLGIISHAIQKAKADVKLQPPTKTTSSTPTNPPLSYAAIAAKQQQHETVRRQRTKTEVTLALTPNTNPDALANQIQRADLPEETLRQLIEEHINSELKTPREGYSPGKTANCIQLLGAKRIAKGILKLKRMLRPSTRSTGIQLLVLKLQNQTMV